MKPTPAEETFESRYGIPASESAVPAVRDSGYGAARPTTREGGGFKGWLKGAALTLGIMYAIGWVSITAIVATANNFAWRPSQLGTTYERTVVAEVVRPYTLAPDPRITPTEAGRAYMALQPRDLRTGQFRIRAVQNRPDVAWRNWGTLDEALFPTARPTTVPGLPNTAKIITAAARGFSARELEVLRQIATSPVWREFEIVARSGGMDIVGAQFELPFGATENVFDMPISQFAGTRTIAHAGASRAAWYLSQGRADLAEAALRAVVSVGFALIDNAVAPFEQLIGNVIVGTGRDGLTQLFAVTRDPRGAAIEAAVKERTRNHQIPPTLSDLNLRNPSRQHLIAVADDPTLTRATRYQALMHLSIRTCTNPVELATGPSSETRDAFARARANLARYPGELAFLDLVEGVLTRPLPGVAPTNSVDGSIEGAASGVSALFFNPRLRSCTLIAGDLSPWR